MTNLIKKTILTGLGIVSLTKDKAEKLVKDLIKEGERLLEKVSHESGVPIAFSVVPDFLDVGTFEDFKNKLFTIKRFFPNDQEV